MMVIRRAGERTHQGRRRETWLTFDAHDAGDPLAHGFGAIERLDEVSLAPGASVPGSARFGCERLTYVYQGVLAHTGKEPGAALLRAGEFERLTSGRALQRSTANGSRIHPARLYQIEFRTPLRGREPDCANRRFSAAERRDGLRAVASHDGRQGSLCIHQDAIVYSALLDPGQHIACALAPGRRAWLHVVQGQIRVGDNVLMAGDGAGITVEHAVSLTACATSEILLADVDGTFAGL